MDPMNLQDWRDDSVQLSCYCVWVSYNTTCILVVIKMCHLCRQLKELMKVNILLKFCYMLLKFIVYSSVSEGSSGRDGGRE